MEIREHAEDLLRKAGVVGNLPVPVEHIAQTLGYQVVQFSPSADTEQVLGAVNYEKKTIYINEDDNPLRKMFTLAHEIGHVVLHSSATGGAVDRRTDSDSERAKPAKEWEADSFAGELLMPEKSFKTHWREHCGLAHRVAAVYAVSRSAVSVRASVLGLTG